MSCEKRYVKGSEVSRHCSYCVVSQYLWGMQVFFAYNEAFARDQRVYAYCLLTILVTLSISSASSDFNAHCLSKSICTIHIDNVSYPKPSSPQCSIAACFRVEELGIADIQDACWVVHRSLKRRIRIKAKSFGSQQAKHVDTRK